MFVSVRISVFSSSSSSRAILSRGPRPAGALASYLFGDLYAQRSRDACVMEVHDRMMEWFRFFRHSPLSGALFSSGRPPFVTHKALYLLAP